MKFLKLFKNKNVQPSGFTIMEAIIYTAIISGILTVAILFTWDVINNQTKSVVMVEVSQNSRYILEKIARDVRQATALNSLSAEEISLTLLSGDVVIYSFTNNTLTRQLNLDSPVSLNSSVTTAVGTWTNLSTSQSNTISLDLIVAFLSSSQSSDWQAEVAMSTSYELNLAP